MILALHISVNFKNSANCGRISYALFPEKQEKIAANWMCSYAFGKLLAGFYINFATALTLYNSTYTKPLNTISIATLKAA